MITQEPRSILGPNNRLDLIDFCYEITQRMKLKQQYDVDTMNRWIVTFSRNIMGDGSGLSLLLRGEEFPEKPNEEQALSLRILHSLMFRSYDNLEQFFEKFKDAYLAYYECARLKTGALSKITKCLVLICLASLIVSLMTYIQIELRSETQKFFGLFLAAYWLRFGIKSYTDNQISKIIERVSK